MPTLKPGNFRAGVDREYDKVFPLADGLVATDGVQYSGVATFGTVNTEIFSKTFNPGPTIKLDQIQVGLTQKFTGLNGSFVGSISYWWEMYPQYTIPSSGFPVAVTGTTINITGTYQKGVGTLTTSEDTFSGNVPIGSIPYAPITIALKATGVRAAVCTGKVKSSSYVRLIGTTLPGT